MKNIIYIFLVSLVLSGCNLYYDLVDLEKPETIGERVSFQKSQTYPYNCVVFVGGETTGVLVDKNTVLTAAHAIGSNDSLNLAPAFWGEPTDPISPAISFIHPAYDPKEDDNYYRFRHDIGVLKSSTDYYRDKYPKIDFDFELYHKEKIEVTVIGYDYHKGKVMKYEANATYLDFRENILIYHWGKEGWSGSPVFYKGKIIGIVVSSNDDRPYVYATPISKNKRFIKQYIEE